MAKLPTVAIIGRPNTGKSTLFNRLLGQSRAIVSEVAGTTRDHVSVEIRGDTVDYLLIDTGGIGGGTEDAELEKDVTAQSLLALEHADLILFTVNAKEEITAADHAVVSMLRKKRKRHVPVVLVATKCDRAGIGDERMADLHRLGIADVITPVSAMQGGGIGELETAIEESLRTLHFGKHEREDEAEGVRVALIGKPNVGKSSLINALMSDPQRKTAGRIVSDIPGTTRDPSDTIIRHEGKKYVFVDTAGLRRQARVESDIERSSAFRSIRSLYAADVVALVLDAKEPISQQDKRIARIAVEEGRGLTILINKIDELSADERASMLRRVRADLHFCDFAPMMTVSAQTRENLPKIFPLFTQIADNMQRRLTQRDLQQWYRDAVQRLPSNILSRGKFVTQASDIPPTFVIFVPSPRRVQRSQLRFLESSMRSLFAFDGVPIRFILKEK